MERATVKTESNERGRKLLAYLYQLGFYSKHIAIRLEGKSYVIEYSGEFPGGQENLDAHVQSFQYQHGPFTFELELKEGDWLMTEKEVIDSLAEHGLSAKSKGNGRYEITCDVSYDDAVRALGAFIDDNIRRVSP